VKAAEKAAAEAGQSGGQGGQSGAGGSLFTEGSGGGSAGESGSAASGGGEKSKGEKKAGRMKELNDLRVELDVKELEVREQQQQLLRQEQTLGVLQEELELARRLNAILKSEVERVKEEAKLTTGLCAQVGGF
jgi:hypothetical protein